VQPAQPDQAWALLLGPHADAPPGVGQVPGGPLVVGQAGASNGRHGGGDALVVSDELGCWEPMLAGPLIPIAQPQGLGEQRPLGCQPLRLAGVLAAGRLLGMAPSVASAQPSGQEAAGQGGGPAD
jgi:hypothetical protein